jgi:hypothetical protein
MQRTGINISVEGVAILHRYAQKYDFKGVWDAAGKVVKGAVRTYELEQKHRFATALDCFTKLPDLMKPLTPWKSYETVGSYKILTKGKFSVDQRRFGFVAESEEKARELQGQLKDNRDAAHSHIVFTDRGNIPTMQKVKDTLLLHSVMGCSESRSVEKRGGAAPTKKYKLLVANMPCACRACRKKCRGVQTNMTCDFENIRLEREVWGSLQAKKKRREVDATEIELYKQVAAALKLQNEKEVTCNVLKQHLIHHNASVTGKKRELAERLLKCISERNETEKQQENPPPLNALAVNYIRTIDDLYDDEDEELEDESADEETGGGTKAQVEDGAESMEAN